MREVDYYDPPRRRAPRVVDEQWYSDDEEFVQCESPNDDKEYPIDDNLAPLMTVTTKYLERRIDNNRYPYTVEAGAPLRHSEKSSRPTDPYAMNVLNVTTHYDFFQKETHRTLAIRSPFIKKMLDKVIGDTWEGVSFVTANVELKFPLQVFYHNMDKIEKAVQEAGEKVEDTPMSKAEVGHLKYFLDFLVDEFADIKKELQVLQQKKVITFDLAWTLFKPGDKVFHRIEGEPRVGTVSRCSDHLENIPPPPPPNLPNYRNANRPRYVSLKQYNVDIQHTDFDGFTSGTTRSVLHIYFFPGTCRIDKLSVFPLCYHRKEKEITERLIARGGRYEDLINPKCMNFKGEAYEGVDYFDFTEPSRVMIDVHTYGREFPGNRAFVRPFNYDTLVWPRKIEDTEEEEKEKEEKDGKKELLDDSDDDFDALSDVEKNNNSIKEPIKIKLTDDQKLQCPHNLPGYSFNEKRWMWFKIDGISEVTWDKTAFESLVLPGEQKDLIRSLVESHINTKQKKTGFDDLIKSVNKGRGLISVIHGPPGVGKTLTAESIADYVQRPLYSVSSGELATNAQDLNYDLKRIFELAATWDAVLLLDEADVFLEERASRDIDRNALVAIFLKLIEYYPGILFLTSNRVRVFDPAFYSRIHVAMQYKDLDHDSRRQVWQNFFERTGSDTVDVSPQELEELASRRVNGREIKNTMRIAQGLAIHKGEKLSMKHIKPVLTLAEEFDKGMKEIAYTKN